MKDHKAVLQVGSVMDVEFGNAGEVETGGTGWFVGYGEWVEGLRFVGKEEGAKGVMIKWMVHEAEDPRGGVKPVSEGRTVSVLVSEGGRFRLEFSESADFAEVRAHTLSRHGDYVIWGAGVYHRWAVEEGCVVMTVRWGLQ